MRDLEDNFSVPLDKARMGSLVKFDGLVQLFDMKIMRNLWEPSMRAALLSQVAVMPDDARQQSSRKQRREHSQQQVKVPDAVKLGLEIPKEIPHLINMTFMAPSGMRFWAAVQPDYLTISSDALLMKFGAVVDGVWTVVGIVDGRIGDTSEPVKTNPMLDGVLAATASIRKVIGPSQRSFRAHPDRDLFTIARGS